MNTGPSHYFLSSLTAPEHGLHLSSSVILSSSVPPVHLSSFFSSFFCRLLLVFLLFSPCPPPPPTAAVTHLAHKNTRSGSLSRTHIHTDTRHTRQSAVYPPHTHTPPPHAHTQTCIPCSRPKTVRVGMQPRLHTHTCMHQRTHTEAPCPHSSCVT